jgi:hypothetical protein
MFTTSNDHKCQIVASSKNTFNLDTVFDNNKAIRVVNLSDQGARKLAMNFFRDKTCHGKIFKCKFGKFFPQNRK